jgi:hypothetical protein
MRDFFRRRLARPIAAYQRFVSFVVEHPILFVPAALIYLALTALNAAVAFGIGYGLASLIASDPLTWERLAITSGFSYFALSGLLLWGDYLFLGVRCFLPVARFSGSPKPILRVIQLVGVSVLLFALVHYYVALFAHAPAYHGIEVLPEKQLSWYPIMGRLMTVPSWETVVNCLYFSTVTMATVGYGDIYPLTIYAKLATIIQIGASFGLIAVILAWAIGEAQRGQKV